MKKNICLICGSKVMNNQSYTKYLLDYSDWIKKMVIEYSDLLSDKLVKRLSKVPQQVLNKLTICKKCMRKQYPQKFLDKIYREQKQLRLCRK